MAGPSKVPQVCTEANSSNVCDLSSLTQSKELTVKLNDKVCSVQGSAYQCGDTALPKKFSPGFTPARLTVFKGNKIIESAQVYLPKPTLRAKGKILESELENELNTLKGNSSKSTIQLGGNTYSLTGSDSVAAINNLLAQEGSAMRLLVGADLSGRKIIAYGEAQREELTVYNGKTVRVVTFGKLKISDSVPITTQAFNDQESMVAIFSNNSSQLMSDRKDHPTYSKHYKFAVHQQVYREFFGPMGGIANPANLALFNELVGKHERRHFAFQAKYGHEPASLAIDLKSQELPLLMESHADLGVLEHLLSLSASNPEEAKRGLIAWSVYRGGRTSDVSSIANELNSNLMLSAMEVKQGKIVVNWEKLRTNTSSFKQLLEKEIFDDLDYHIQVGMLAQMREPQYHANLSTPIDEVRRKYKALKDALIDGVKRQKPALSQEVVKRDVAGRISEQLQRYSALFLEGVVQYQSSIDQWMIYQLKLTKQQAPFRVSY